MFIGNEHLTVDTWIWLKITSLSSIASVQMSIANEHTDTFYLADFDFKDPVNATYIMAF